MKIAHNDGTDHRKVGDGVGLRQSAAHRLLQVFGWLLVGATGGQPYAATYKASGVIISKVYSPVISSEIPPGKEILTHQYKMRFEVSIEGCCWLVRIEPIDVVAADPVIRSEVSCDGTNMFYLTFWR